MPDHEELEARQMRAARLMSEKLTAVAGELMDREIGIATGKITDGDGVAAPLKVQAEVLHRLRQQVMGNPLQRVEQTSRSLKVVAHYELPTEKIDKSVPAAVVPKELVRKPTLQIEPMSVTAAQPTGREQLHAMKKGTWEQALDADFDPKVGPRIEETEMKG